MAYGTKYHFQITDFKGVKTLVNLKLRDYTGYNNALAKGGLSFEFGASLATNVVRGSSATVGLWSLTQGQFSEFRDITDRKWMVEVIKGGNPYWVGWLTPEIFSEPFKHSLPYRIEVTAVDGLGDLSNIDYLTTAGARYAGRSAFRTVINNCLKAIGFSLNVCFSAAIRPTGTTGDPFDICYIAHNSFVDSKGVVLKCNEVLERFFVLGITVKQWRGKWYVLRTEDLGDAVKIYEYDSTGAYVDDYYLDLNYNINNPTDTAALNIITGQSGVMSQAQAFKEASVKIDYGKKASFLNNYDFSMSGDSWTSELPSYNLLFMQATDAPYAFLSLMDTSGATTGIRQSVAVVASSKDFVFSVKVAPFAWMHPSSSTNEPKQSIPMTVKFQVKLTGSLTTYYLDKDAGWITTPTFITIDNLDSTVTLGADVTWHEIKIITASIPVAGYIDVYLCKVPYVNMGTRTGAVLGVGYTEVKVFPNDDAYTATLTVKGVNNSDYNYTPSDVDVLIDDCPNVENARALYSNYISDYAGVPTITWTNDGIAGTYTLAELYLRHAIGLHRRPQKVVSATMIAAVEWPGTLSDADGNRYEVVSATLMDRNCEWQLELREILTVTGTPAITNGTRTTDNAASTNRTVNGANDYRVYQFGFGNPKRITDLDKELAIDETTVFETDKPGSAASKETSIGQITDYMVNQIITNDLLHDYLGKGGTNTVPDNRTQLISGAVVWDHDLTYNSTKIVYILQGETCQISPQSVTLDAADPTLPRIDAFYVDGSSTLNVLKGTPSNDGIIPQVGAGQIMVGYAIIMPNATSPNLVVTTIYDERTAGEWIASSTQDEGISVDLDATTAPFSDSKNIDISIAIPETAVASPTHFIGEHYQGGIIFKLERGGKSGKIAATSAASPATIYSENHVTGANSTVDGKANTTTLMANPIANLYAAFYASTYTGEGLSDWYLGAVDDIKELNFRKSFFPNLAKLTLWSSTEVTGSNDWKRAICVAFSNDTAYVRDKSNSYAVVPIRDFNDDDLPVNVPVGVVTPSETTLIFDAPDPLDLKNWILSFYMKTTAEWLPNTAMTVRFYSDTNPRGLIILSKNNGMQGFNSADEQWQMVALPSGLFSLQPGTVNRLKIELINSWPNNTVISIDRVRLQYDDSQTPVNTVTPGTYGDADHHVRVTINAQGVITAIEEVEQAGGGGDCSEFERWLGLMFMEGEKITGLDAGMFGAISIAQPYEYRCVVAGAPGVAVWLKKPLARTDIETI